MITFIVSALTALAIMFGSAPVATVEAPVEASQVQVEQPVDAVLLMDAWASYDDMEPVESDSEMVLSYVESVESDSYPKVATVYGYFAVPSLDFPNTYHVFEWSTLTNA